MQNVQHTLQNMQHTLQNVQYPLQNMQYQIKLSPSYPQSYPQKGVIPCKTCSDNCKMCSTKCKIRSITCKIRSTHCKICSTKQSYPQVIPRVIPKKVLPTAKCAVTHAKYTVPPAKYAVSNKVIPKLSPELSTMDLSQKNGLEK